MEIKLFQEKTQNQTKNSIDISACSTNSVDNMYSPVREHSYNEDWMQCEICKDCWHEKCSNYKGTE